MGPVAAGPGGDRIIRIVAAGVGRFQVMAMLQAACQSAWPADGQRAVVGFQPGDLLRRRQAWDEALRIVSACPRAVLESQSGFYEQVYRPRRDELAKRWTERAGADEDVLISWLFTGGLGMHYGGELVGMTVIPMSGGNTERQILALQDFGVRVIACTSSYALTLAEALAARGVKPGSLALRCGVLGAEPWTEAMRKQIEAQLGISAVNIYGLSEVIGPGVSNECVEARAGSHIFEDHFLAEVVDPQSGDPLPTKQIGELVLTTLTKEAVPVIRYRTGDLTWLNPEPCRCCRTHLRMGPVLGRTDDMLIIRGVNLYPSQVESALLAISELSPHYQLVVTRARTLDDLEVRIEVTEAFAREIGGVVDETHVPVVALAERCRRTLRSALGLTTRVTLAAPGSLPRSEGGKLRRVRDERKL